MKYLCKANNIQMKNRINTKMVNIRINDSMWKNFKNFCDEKGYSISKRIRILIENDMTKL